MFFTWWQVFIESNSGLAGSDLEREFFILRKLIEKEKVQRFAAEGVDSSDFYICTLSTTLIVYKVWHSFFAGYTSPMTTPPCHLSPKWWRLQTCTSACDALQDLDEQSVFDLAATVSVCATISLSHA